MTKTLKNYEIEFGREFYTNYVVTIKNLTPSGKDKNMKRQPQLDMIRVQNHKVDISIKAIFNALFRKIFEPVGETLKYDF